MRYILLFLFLFISLGITGVLFRESGSFHVYIAGFSGGGVKL